MSRMQLTKGLPEENLLVSHRVFPVTGKPEIDPAAGFGFALKYGRGILSVREG
jgi:hypothetical protein